MATASGEIGIAGQGSSVATRQASIAILIRGLKSTATVPDRYAVDTESG